MSNCFGWHWQCWNIPLQISLLAQSPEKVGLLAKIKRGIESDAEGEPLDEELIPDWMKDGYGVFLGENPGGMKRYLKMEGFLPTVDIGKLNKPGDFFLGQLSPLIKNPIELMANYDLFLEKQIKETEGVTESIFGMGGVDPRVRHATIKNIRPLRDIERTLGLAPEDAGKDISAMDRLLSFFTGINIKELDGKKQADILDMLTDKEINAIKKEAKKLRKNGDIEGAQRLNDVIQEIKSGEREIKL